MGLLFQHLKQGSFSGQIVVIAVLFLAVIVVFIAVVINLGKIAQIKGLVSIAADNAAITTASSAGSWALAMTVANEGERNCGPSPWIKFILKAAAWVIKAIISAITLGQAAVALPFELYGLIQETVNAGEIREMLNQQMQRLTVQQRFLETALQTGLYGVVSDLKEIDDEHDIDMDTLTNAEGDTVNRFNFLNMLRLLNKIDKGSGQLKQAIENFYPVWRDFTCYLGADKLGTDISPCSYPGTAGGFYSVCLGRGYSGSFLTTLGEDNGSLFGPPYFGYTSTGIYRLFYDVENWGYGSLWGPPQNHELWRRIYQPCAYVTPTEAPPAACNPSQERYCQLPNSSDWLCMGAASRGFNDGVDDMKFSMERFVQWSSSVLGRPNQSCDRVKMLQESFDSWYPSLYSPSGDSWYDIIPLWQNELTKMNNTLEEVARWILYEKCKDILGNPVDCALVCAEFNADGSCKEYWSERLDRVKTALNEGREAETETREFYTALKTFKTAVETISWPDRVSYSWKDNLGWHHVYVQVEHTPNKFPTIKTDTGFLEECRELKPKFCGRRGGGAIKMRVIRYDQNSSNTLSFAGGKSLWRFLFTHPGSSGDSSFSLTDCEIGGPTGGRPDYTYKYIAPDAGFNCAGIDTFLLQGVKSEACAEYGPLQDYIKFIPCDKYTRYTEGKCE